MTPPPERVTGEFNSSITRVWPVFRQLLGRDGSGASWIPAVLRLAPAGAAVRDVLARQLAPLRAGVKETRLCSTAMVERYRPDGVSLEQCFERRVAPPAAFLEWLVAHPAELDWRRKDLGNSTTDKKRSALRGDKGPTAQQAVIAEALQAIETLGGHGSERRWWAFEGFTSVDCCLESDEALLFVEGKRTDVLSEATAWYPTRNQVVRNLEVAEVEAAGRPFGLLVISETGDDPLTDETFVRGLPHFPPVDQARLRGHYLGCVSWSEVCGATGVDYTALPQTVKEALTGER